MGQSLRSVFRQRRRSRLEQGAAKSNAHRFTGLLKAKRSRVFIL